MDAAVAALVGAGIGAVVPAIVAVLSSKQARAEGREARLFDHRRDAYTEFIREANGLAAQLNKRYLFEGEEPPAPEADVLRRVIDLETLVLLYGTQRSGKLASEAVVRLARFIHGGPAKQNPTVFEFQIAMEEFVRQARLDLGVTP